MAERIDRIYSINRTTEIFLLVLIGILFVMHLGIHSYHVATEASPAERIPFTILTPIFAGLAFVHGVYMMGWRRTLAFFVLTVVISIAFEYVGATTGAIFGAYYYTDFFGPKLFNTVPAVVPLAYFMVMYPSTLMASILITGKPDPERLPLGWLLISAFLGSLIMSAWDLSLDPLMSDTAANLNLEPTESDKIRAWIWIDGGPYFGVPWQNFSGWVLTNLTIGLAYRFVEQYIPLKPQGRITRGIVLIPIIAYIVLWFGDFWVGYPVDTRLIGPFAMGIPALIVILRMYEPGGEAAQHILRRQLQSVVQ